MNRKIFINGSSSKIGGSRQILNSLVEKISDYGDEEDYEYIILVPNIAEFKHIKKKHIFFKQIPETLNKTFLVPINSLFLIPSIIKKSNIDIVLNLGDIPLKTSIKQIMLFDWPYAIYDDPLVWKLMSNKEFIARKIKLIIFKYLIKNVDIMLAQTSVAKNRLLDRYKDIKKINIFPNAVATDHFKISSIPEHDDKISNKFNLLCLSAYYAHKNLEVFIETGKILRDKDIPAKIFLTIDPDQNENAKKLIKNIYREKIDSHVVNLGSVQLSDVPSLYRRVDALILPTLLESFSGTYVESMWNKKIVLTSDKDFAKVICGKNAFYFNPLDPQSICEKIIYAINNKDEVFYKEQKAFKMVGELPDWNTVYFSMIKLFKGIS